MHNRFIFFILLFSLFFTSTSYAIQVNLQSDSKDIFALGFTVNKKSHGGMGNTYSKKDLPTGVYTFGVRIGGLTGEDITCLTKTGKNTIELTQNSTVVLNYNNKHCTLKIYSGIRS